VAVNRSRADQSLVNAQVSVNRAVFEMNRQHNGEKPRPDYIVDCIDAAESELAEARRYYQLQAGKVKS
jgi:tRNA A37 threonylcarbamoyladenosine dehydratase